VIREFLWERLHLERFHPLGGKVRRIERAMKRLAKARSSEPTWVAEYGAFYIDPRHLVYWICVKTDAERDRLASDQEFGRELRELLVTFDYPAEARNHVHIGFESQETVDRRSGGNWFHHWK